VAVAPACVSPCATCSSLTTCITCIVGTYLSGSTCNDCHNAITNCSQCSGSTPTCSNCDPGYIVNTTTNACDVVPCIDINCISCPSTTSICEICNSNGWYLSGIICVSHCGDNILVGTEQCDDGNNVDGDGCNADCTIGNNNGCPAATPYMDPIS
jgi:cysteine-rich repeat protein